jgi:hypothetical protein
MKWLIVAVLIFAHEPAKVPKDKGTAEGKGTQVSKQADASEKRDQPSEPAPSPPANNQHSSPEEQPAAPKASNDTEIQGKIKTFTGLLVVVGFLQFFALIGQVVIYCRQAKIMARQAHEMKRQRGYMRLQWRSMRQQLAQMQASGEQTDDLIEFAEKQVAALRNSANAMFDSVEAQNRIASASLKSANAAKQGAEAAAQNIELYISKERARLRVSMKTLNLPPDPDQAYTVDFAVSIHGPTDAFISESLCTAYVFPSTVIDDPDLGMAVMYPIHVLPSVISANRPPLDCYAFLPLHVGDDTVQDELKTGSLVVGVRGFIKYKDVFDRDRITAFRYIWKVAEDMELAPIFGNWVNNGNPEENNET